ncbi:hypothetical protein RIF29_15430 [Crotalaria pallida]|uniref:Uncharacterized protein n=1 Tax=Crotalaria pallida TaxID=3830 RepID=A0AAN9IEM4_CROPI
MALMMQLSMNSMTLNLEGLRLKSLQKELSQLGCLEELKLSDSAIVIDKQQLHVIFDGLKSLQVLHLKGLSNMDELPDNIAVLTNLRELRLDGSSVKCLPARIKNLEKLEIMFLDNCREHKSLPELPPNSIKF